jgi:murein L,D-transpeptidase YafK
VVIIDKAAYRLYLVQAGAITHSYPVELGFDPVNDKRMEGDGTTPEGPYRVTEKRDIGQTSYYRGWMLSYPEERDQQEFVAAQADGSIPADATVGSAIMIHGSGSGLAGNGAGRNWTLGCIALSNEQVDSLFPHISVGDPVVIVRYTSVPLQPGN